MTEQNPFVHELEQALSTLAVDARPTEGCPEAQEIWRASRGEIPAKRSRALLRHATSCAACLEAWRLAREIAASAPGGELGGRDNSRRPWVLGSLAVAAVLAIVLVSPRLMRQPVEPTYRDDVAAPVRSLLPDDRPLTRDDCVLRWTPGPDGATYRLEVATLERGVLVSRRGLTQPAYRLPQEALAEVSSGSRLLWRVTVVYPDGREESSVTFLSVLE